MRPLTHVDLFSGIGGFALAARWAGFETKCFSEIDTYASAVLKKHWPDVPNLGDITKADFGPYSGATLLTGGFPCQPFSCAGKQRGKEDDRFLWPAMLAAIATVKPTWIVGENVTGIIRMELDRVLADLEGQGYSALPIVIPACATDARHRRDRIWILANSSSGRCSSKASGKIQQPRGTEAFRAGETDADRDREREPQPQGGEQKVRGRASDVCRWPAEPPVGRVAHGIPRRVDRIKGLGNAIVPQVAFQILKAIEALESKN